MDMEDAITLVIRNAANPCSPHSHDHIIQIPPGFSQQIRIWYLPPDMNINITPGHPGSKLLRTCRQPDSVPRASKNMQVPISNGVNQSTGNKLNGFKLLHSSNGSGGPSSCSRCHPQALGSGKKRRRILPFNELCLDTPMWPTGQLWLMLRDMMEYLTIYNDGYTMLQMMYDDIMTWWDV